ncbi:helix-turn-helix domain-containing protein [Streptacidiphilus sp. MAP5-3]|uniref:helix-turn-helix domain-containing protein n=1 Tax=unclassified Streptacidiphilus TaxID=2643834 RepID=UPI003516BEB0
MPDDLLTVPEVMLRLKLGRSTVYDLIRTGRLPSITIGRARRIHPEALRSFVNTRMEEAA